MEESPRSHIALSPRLHAAASFVPQGAKLADIGSDHAYLPVWLWQNGRLASAIASDIRAAPLERGRAAALQAGIPPGCIDFRLCDGLAGLAPGEADTLVMAGMGGETIAAILAQAPFARNETLRFILQPMTAASDLRLWLSENGFVVEEERLAREGKRLYAVLSARFAPAREGEALTLGERWAGRAPAALSRKQAELRIAYIDDCLKRREAALAGLLLAAREAPEEAAELRETLADLRKLRAETVQRTQARKR
jgi:tRNA (adenine22-N1)-methyltransferase